MRKETSALLGKRLGHIRIADLIGEGGMGAVFLAYDDTLQRKVAVKAIRSKFRLNPEAKARFLREARILSQLNHPNICTVHDFIEEEQIDFLVLEHVEGRSLRTALNEGLQWPEKLEIARQLLEVLAAVHGEGVVHRDLKPENVMIQPSGAIKVLDFGLARSTEEEGVTPTSEATLSIVDTGGALVGDEGEGSLYVKTKLGSVIGTAGYMSPEQARGEPATSASDMYSVGLMLQEMFTGSRPLAEGLEPSVLLQRAASGETAPVSGLPRDITEFINRLKSLAPGARPSSVDATAQLQFIADKPKRKRKRLLIAAVWLALLMLSIGLGLQSLRATREAKRAEQEAKTARQVSSFLVDIFSVSDPSEAKGNEITAREVLHRGAERISDELADEPEIQAKLMSTMGEVFMNLGLYADAEKLLEKAAENQRHLLGSDHPDTLETINTLASLRWYQARHEDAEKLFLEVVQARSRTLGEEHPSTMSARNDLAVVYASTDRQDEALRVFLELLEIQLRVLGEQHSDTLETMNNVQVIFYRQARYPEAEAMAIRVLEGHRRVNGADHPLTILALFNLGTIYRDTGRLQEAERTIQEACDAFERVLGETHDRTIRCTINLAGVYTAQGRFEEAEQQSLESFELASTKLGQEHQITGLAKRQLADLYLRWGRTTEAAKYEERPNE